MYLKKKSTQGRVIRTRRNLKSKDADRQKTVTRDPTLRQEGGSIIYVSIAS